MPSISDPHAVSEVPSRAPDRMPRAVRGALILVLAGLMSGAVYLVAVRGEALLVDLAALGARLWCF